MTHPTKAQLDRAAALIKATAADEKMIPQLGRMIEAATLVADAEARACNNAVDFAVCPDNLATIPALIQRNPDMKQGALIRYRLLLSDMINPVAGFAPPQINFHTLAPAARPYLLAPFLKLAVNGVYPLLDVERSDTARGVLAYTVTSGVFDRAAWMARLDDASAWLGGNYQITSSTSTTITLTRRPELPKQIPFDPSWLKAGHLMLGIAVDTQQPFYVALDRMTHLLVAGTPGTGKSVFLHAFLKSCLHSIAQFQHIYAVCGQGIAFERYRGLHPKLTVTNDTEHLHMLVTDLQIIMKERTARLVAEQRDKMGEYILVLIDEWGAFNNPEGTDKASKDAHAAFMQNMMHLGKRGRKVGIRLALVVQEPVERDLATGIRSNLQSIVSFRLPLAAHGQALFGEITPPAVPADPRTLPTGRAIFHDGTTSVRTLFQVPVVPPPGRR